MNVKIIFAGGLAMYVVQLLLSFATAPLIHEGVLEAAYQAHASFWRPELVQDPPDMAALMPLWITTGVVGALVLAGIYSALRPAFAGPGWSSGMRFGFTVWLVQLVTTAGWSGVFNLPYEIWGWWSAEGLVFNLVGGAVLGMVAAKLAPASA